MVNINQIFAIYDFKNKVKHLLFVMMIKKLRIKILKKS